MADDGQSMEQAAARDGFVEAGGLRFHYREWGDPAAPPLLLLHGIWETAQVWKGVAPALAAHFRVLALDQRGHGASDRASDYRWGRWADDLAAIAEALALGPFTLIGHSAGCVVAFIYASRQPATLDRLVLIEHGPDATDQVRALVARLGRTIAPPEHVDSALSLPALFDLVEPPALTDEWERLPAITCPTLIVRAERSDRFPRATAERMLTLIPDSRLVEIAGSRHPLPKEAPAALSEALLAFLAPSAPR